MNATRNDGDIELLFNRLLRSAAILVVDDEPGMRNFLKRAFEDRCALLEVAGSAEEAEALRLRYHFDLLLVDIRLPGLSGLDWMEKLRERGVRTHVIYMTAYADLDMAVSALRNGADDFIMKPFRTEQIFMSMRRTLMRRQILRENSLLRLQVEQMREDDGLVGESEAMLAMSTLIQRVAATRSTVLVQGENGVGKAQVARVLHRLSRRGGPFIAFNCGTVDPEQIDSELFGYVKGAFEGANQTRDGMIAHADKGTLFLDEVARLPESVQTKLLGVLERGVLRPLGSAREFPVDVRFVAATTSDLEQLGASGMFRSDLLYRLNSLHLQVPPLRDRGRDIELLVQHFMEQLSSELRLAPVQLLHADWERLHAYHWPGNVRELRNVVERTLLLGELPLESLGKGEVVAPVLEPGYPLDWSMEQVERAHIEAVLESLGNNKSAAARQLGVSRKTLERKQALWSSSGGNE
ncbi:sigma-54-dependent transcriptional regulator [Granulosicoccus sp. 3-233]|uniref:sigma-54-dependent transcriptional regulator n=1 Tax=Granulosicoccus sp. 3-233 TaxID=3417969 RepID=UPI003D355E5A